MSTEPLARIGQGDTARDITEENASKPGVLPLMAFVAVQVVALIAWAIDTAKKH